MTQKSKTLEIMRRIGAPEPKKIGIIGIIQSPELASFNFTLPGGDADSSAGLLNLLGSYDINIRFMTKYADPDGNTALCLCVESAFLDDVVALIDTGKLDLGIREFTCRTQIRIISIYPHKERARVAERLFTTLEMNGIELLSANNASSVISCVLHGDSVDQALACLRQAFELP